LADPSDPKADVAARARSYLHANCAQCHVEAGGGNAQIDLEFTTALEKMRVVDVKPQHHTFELPDARLVAPGHPERSVLLRRMGRGGRAVGDGVGGEVGSGWIRRLGKQEKKTRQPE